MNRLPSPGQWKQKAITIIVLVAIGPVLLVALENALNEAIGPLLSVMLPYGVVFLVLAGIYRLVLGRRR